MDPPGNNSDILYSPPNCIWTVTIVDCIDQYYYQIIYNITIYLSLIVFLLAIGLLTWRLYNKPDKKLLCVKGFLAMEGFLFTQIFWSILRVLNCFILLYNFFPTSLMIRHMLFTISWLLGSISVTTYLAGVLRTIPRMHFYRQNPKYQHELHLPTLRSVTIIYFCYISTLGIIVITCSFFVGYLQINPGFLPNPILTAYIFSSVEFGIFAIGCFLLSLGFMIYGSKLVDIASEGLELLEGVNDYQSHIKSKGSRNTTYSTLGLELELKHKRLKRSVHKMRVINIGFIISILILGIILAASAFFSKQLNENEVSNKIFAAMSNVFPMLINVAVMLGIAYGEMKVSNKDDINSDTPKTNNPPPPRESIETVVIHTRDPSTDSEIPLLSWPAAAVLSKTHHYNHYDVVGSIGNNVNVRKNNFSTNSFGSNNSFNLSSNNVNNNNGRIGQSRRPSVSTTTSSLNSPINSTPMRISYNYI